MISDLSLAPTDRDFDYADSFGGSLFGSDPSPVSFACIHP